MLEWWLQSARWVGDGMTGLHPIGIAEWPHRGGMLRQPARLVDAVTLLQNEWPRLRERVEG